MIAGDKYTFNQDNVNKAPDTAGVYTLYQGSELIYYGRAQGGSVTIRSRLQDHFSGREGACTKAATVYKRETTANAVEREKALITEYLVTNGRLPRCNDRAA